MNTEIWADIINYEGLYSISDLGRVKNNRGKILKVFITEKGYIRCSLSKSGKRRKHFVHRLVGRAFVPNPFGKPFINHKDGIKSHNVPDNLEWNTSKENNTHKHEVLGYRPSEISNQKRRITMSGFKNSEEMKAKMREIAKGESNNMAKLSEKEVAEIFNISDTNTAIAKIYNVSRRAIADIKNGRTWKYLTMSLS